MNVVLVIRCQFMDLGIWKFSKVQSNYWIWNDSNTDDSADDLFELPAKQFFNATMSKLASCLWNYKGGIQ